MTQIIVVSVQVVIAVLSLFAGHRQPPRPVVEVTQRPGPTLFELHTCTSGQSDTGVTGCDGVAKTAMRAKPGPDVVTISVTCPKGWSVVYPPSVVPVTIAERVNLADRATCAKVKK